MRACAFTVYGERGQGQDWRMSAELDALLSEMLDIARARAVRAPTPADPPDDAWSEGADEICLRFARTQRAELPSPEVACALIPRLEFARIAASPAEHLLDMQARATGDAAGEGEILEFLLVTLWHRTGKARWLAGMLEEKN